MTTASVPRNAGNGTALIVVVADFVVDLFGKAAVVRKAKAAPKVVAVEKEHDLDVWQLYRLSAGSDSVNPKTGAKLREMADKN